MAQGLCRDRSKDGEPRLGINPTDTNILVQNSYGARIDKGRIPPAGNIQLVARMSDSEIRGLSSPHVAPLMRATVC